MTILSILFVNLNLYYLVMDMEIKFPKQSFLTTASICPETFYAQYHTHFLAKVDLKIELNKLLPTDTFIF